MKTRTANVWAGIAAAAVGVALIAYGFARTNVAPFHGLRFTMLGAAIFTLAAAHLAAAYWLGRVKVLHSIYALGYRHGRHDSSIQLIEDGLWLTTKEPPEEAQPPEAPPPEAQQSC